ncbi:MAG TPA: HipA family kinase [Clostridiaceae bacterium]
MDILKIDKLERLVGNGCTEPMLATAGDKKVVVKVFNNLQGNRVLINELISYYIAKQLGLNVPPSGVCEIGSFTKVNESIYKDSEFSDENYGYGFFSTYLSDMTVVNSHKIIMFAQNYKRLIPLTMLFDHLIYNADRNKGNLLINITKSNKELFIIDHTHTFNKQCIWDSYSLTQCMEDKDVEDLVIMKGNAYIYGMFRRTMDINLSVLEETKAIIESKLNKSFFEGIVNLIPPAWNIGEKEKIVLPEYLNYRLSNIDKFISIILNYDFRRN